MSLVFVGLSDTISVPEVQLAVGVFFFLFEVVKGCLVAVVQHYLLEHQVLEVFLAKRKLFEIEVKSTNGLSRWLIVWVVQGLQVFVLEGIFYCNSLLWVVGQHLLQKVNSLRRGILEKLFKIFTVAFGELKHEVSVFLIFNLINQLGRWVTEEFGYHVELLLL